MAYSEVLAARVREALHQEPALTEKKMFGGVGFMLAGNMCCGVLGDDLMVRLGQAQAAAAFANPYVRLFDMTGRPMKGWVIVAGAGLIEDEELRAWVRQSVTFAATLPPK